MTCQTNVVDSPIELWGLVFAADLPDEPSHKTFFIRNQGHSGVLTFASALDAEIYCSQLAATGMPGWRRAPLERIDLSRVMSLASPGERKIMLALGFHASDTNDLLADEDQTLLTPLLPIPYRMTHSLHGLSQLHINHEVCDFIEQWWDRVGGDQYSEQVRMTSSWSDHELARCADDALSKAAIMNMRQYHMLWSHSGSGDECAVFSPGSGAWCFSTLQGPRQRALH